MTEPTTTAWTDAISAIVLRELDAGGDLTPGPAPAYAARISAALDSAARAGLPVLQPIPRPAATPGL